MRIVQRYITADFVLIFVITLLVFTFVMCVGILLGAGSWLMEAASIRDLLWMMAYGIPMSLSLSIPISLLLASLLLFGRLSADGEITAMKASGIGVWRIASPPLLISIAMCLVCVYITCDMAPKCQLGRRVLLTSHAQNAKSAVRLITEGRFIDDFPGMTIYVARKKDNRLTDIRIYDRRRAGMRREIRAKRGTIEIGSESNLVIRLFDVWVDPLDEKRPGPAFFEEWPVQVADMKQATKRQLREADMSSWELVWRLRNQSTSCPDLKADDLPEEAMTLRVEINKRLALSFACVAFVILGIPLGIRTNRKESSIGIALSLFVVLSFYVFVVIAESLVRYPAFRPDLLLWIPVVVSVGLGWMLFRRAQ